MRLTIFKGRGLCLVGLRAVDAMKQTSKTHGLVVAPILEEVVCFPEDDPKDLRRCEGFFIRVQVEQEV